MGYDSSLDQAIELVVGEKDEDSNAEDDDYGYEDEEY